MASPYYIGTIRTVTDSFILGLLIARKTKGVKHSVFRELAKWYQYTPTF